MSATAPHCAGLSGYGLGLRKEHYRDFLETRVAGRLCGGHLREFHGRRRPAAPYPAPGARTASGRAAWRVDVDRLGRRPAPDYLKRLKALADEIEPLFVSDHLSWSRIGGFNSHDLLPVPYTEEALDIVCANIHQAQDALGRADAVRESVQLPRVRRRRP
jgi:hypothetical protein